MSSSITDYETNSTQTNQVLPFKNDRMIKIENSIVEDSNLSNRAFYLYVYIKIMSKGQNFVNTTSTDILNILKWKTKKTLKQHLNELYEIGLIEGNIFTFPTNKPINIILLEDKVLKNFTQINIKTIMKIQEITEQTPIKIYSAEKDIECEDINGVYITKQHVNLKESAIRLYFLYERYYNRKFQTKTKLTYEQIQQKISISNKFIKSINNILYENKLLFVDIGYKNINNKRSVNGYEPIFVQ
jgi:hypothetical protein